MNTQYKYLIWAGTLVLVVLAVFLVASIDHLSNTATNTNTVSFSGEGRIFAKPDIAIISFSILTEAATSKKAQDDNSAKSEKVVKFFEETKKIFDPENIFNPRKKVGGDLSYAMNHLRTSW